MDLSFSPPICPKPSLTNDLGTKRGAMVEFYARATWSKLKAFKIKNPIKKKMAQAGGAEKRGSRQFFFFFVSPLLLDLLASSYTALLTSIMSSVSDLPDDFLKFAVHFQVACFITLIRGYLISSSGFRVALFVTLLVL